MAKQKSKIIHPLPGIENIYADIFESSLEGISLVDSSGKIRLLNPSMSKMFGYKKNELIGKTVEDLIPKKLRKSHLGHRHGYQKKPVKRAMGMGLDLVAKRKDDTEFPVEISLTPVQAGTENFVMAMIMDISKRKIAQDEIKKLNRELEEKINERTQDLKNAIEELQDLNENLGTEIKKRKKAEENATKSLIKEKELGELKTRFVSMASHEFRTPLSTILSSNSLVARYDSDDLKDKRAKHIKRISALAVGEWPGDPDHARAV